jgi:hypothetical protein
VQDNTAPNFNSIRSYFVWVQGQDVVIVGNKVANSTREHIIRVGGADRVLVAFNDFTNIDRSWTDRSDIAKGTMTLQKGSYIYATRNKVTAGGIGVGPLGGVDGKDDASARAKWVVVDGNDVNGIEIIVAAGSEGVAVRNNVIERNADAGIWLRPTDSYVVNGINVYASRNLYDVTIANNTWVSDGTNGSFLLVENEGAAGQVTLANNLAVATNLTTGQGRTALVYINDDQGSAFRMFRRISGNAWEQPRTLSYAQGGWFYAYGWWSDPAGYLTPTEWDHLAADGDRFGWSGLDRSTFRPSTGGTAASGGGSAAVAGVFSDFYGNNRTGTLANGGRTTAGAVQV